MSRGLVNNSLGNGDVEDLDSGAGTDEHEVFAIGLPASGGHVVGGTATNPIRTDPTGATTQPISDAAGSLTIDSPQLPAALGAGVEAGAILVTVATDSTGVLSVDDGGGSLTVDGPLTDGQLRATAVPVSAASLPLPTGAATAANQNANPTGITEYNLTLTLADTEYSQVLPNGTKAFALRCRTSDVVRYAFTTGKVAASVSPYQTLKASAEYWKDNVSLAAGITVYLASSTAGVIVEIEAWS